MPTGIPLKVVAVTVLVGAALVGRSADWFALGVLAFGIVNAVFSVPGTKWVRGAAVPRWWLSSRQATFNRSWPSWPG